MMQMTDEYFPAEVPPHWGVVFVIADCDATVAKACGPHLLSDLRDERGARVRNKPAPSDVTSTVTKRPSRITFKVNLQSSGFRI
jgi:hypothetical protein